MLTSMHVCPDNGCYDLNSIEVKLKQTDCERLCLVRKKVSTFIYSVIKFGQYENNPNSCYERVNTQPSVDEVLPRNQGF